MTADMLDFGIFGFMKIKDKVGFFITAPLIKLPVRYVNYTTKIKETNEKDKRKLTEDQTVKGII